MVPKLVVMSGPASGESYTIAKEETIIGRGSGCDIRTRDDDLTSRMHCKILVSGGQCILTDLNSKNGTAVNGIPVTKIALKRGDEIRVGTTIFSFVLADQEIPVETHPAKGAARGRIAETAATIILPGENFSPANVSKDSERLRADLAAIYEVGTAVNSIRELGRLLKKLLSILYEVTPAMEGAILVFEAKNKQPVAEERRVRPGADLHPVEIDEALARRVYSDRASVLGSGMYGPYTVLCAPLVALDRTVGVIYLQADAASRFRDEDLHLVTAIGNQAGVGVENARYYALLDAQKQNLMSALRREYDMVGTSAPMKRVYETIQRVAPSDATVLIRGESGTGKELVARAIHYNSPRKDGSLVSVNCGAIPEGLMESELFGHEKGAFTGATSQRKGRFEAADGGTLFLDEVSELDMKCQVKLLRVLEEQKFQRVGASSDISVDVRVIAATNRDIRDAVAEGRFREDLYFRLNVIEMVLPPLRERSGDIAILAQYFLERYREKSPRRVEGFSEEAMAALAAHSWPGNVRELKNGIERAVILGQHTKLLPEDLALAKPAGIPEHWEPRPLKEMEEEHIRRIIDHFGGNKSQAARALGIERSTLYDKMRQYGIPS